MPSWVSRECAGWPSLIPNARPVNATWSSSRCLLRLSSPLLPLYPSPRYRLCYYLLMLLPLCGRPPDDRSLLPPVRLFLYGNILYHTFHCYLWYLIKYVSSPLSSNLDRSGSRIKNSQFVIQPFFRSNYKTILLLHIAQRRHKQNVEWGETSPRSRASVVHYSLLCALAFTSGIFSTAVKRLYNKGTLLCRYSYVSCTPSQ